jgi:hypothetical protein
MLALVSAWLLGTGCAGINAGHSVSPIDFLIPGGGGLMRGLLYIPPEMKNPNLASDSVPISLVPPTTVASAK